MKRRSTFEKMKRNGGGGGRKRWRREFFRLMGEQNKYFFMKRRIEFTSGVWLFQRLFTVIVLQGNVKIS